MTDDTLKPIRRKLLDEDEWREIRQDVSRNETELLRGRIRELENGVRELGRDELMALWHVGNERWFPE